MAGNGGEMVKQIGAGKQQAESNPEQKCAAAQNLRELGAGDDVPRSSRGKDRKTAGPEAEEQELTYEQVQDKLRREATATLGRGCQRFINGLMSKACHGDVRSAQLLFALAEPSEKRKSEAKQRRMLELVKELAAEQEWPIEMHEAATAMVIGEPGTQTQLLAVMAAQ